jgi:ferric enterobactin receptor
LTLLDGSTQDYITAGPKNGRRLPNYHRADVAATYQLRGGPDGTTDRGSIGLSLFNIYNRENTWFKEYQIVSGQVIETDQRFLGFTPNITFSFKLH